MCPGERLSLFDAVHVCVQLHLTKLVLVSRLLKAHVYLMFLR